MSRTSRRLMAVVAIVCGAIAAYGVAAQQQEVRARIGPQAVAVVARATIERTARLDAGFVEQSFARRPVPRTLLPDGALNDPLELIGAELVAPLPAGAIVTQSQLVAASGAAAGIGPGERGVAVPVSFASGTPPVPGARLDVIAAGEAGGGFAELVIAGAETLAVRDAGVAAESDAAGGASSLPQGVVTLRVTVRQAARLLAARAGGASLTVLARPPGDRRVRGPVVERLRAANG